MSDVYRLNSLGESTPVLIVAYFDFVFYCVYCLRPRMWFDICFNDGIAYVYLCYLCRS